MPKKLVAALTALLLMAGLFGLPSPAAAHGERSCTITYEWQQVLVLTNSQLGEQEWTYKPELRPVEHCTTSYNHSHPVCEQWITQFTDPQYAGNDGHVEVGSVGFAVCVLWVMRGH